MRASGQTDWPSTACASSCLARCEANSTWRRSDVQSKRCSRWVQDPCFLLSDEPAKHHHHRHGLASDVPCFQLPSFLSSLRTLVSHHLACNANVLTVALSVGSLTHVALLLLLSSPVVVQTVKVASAKGSWKGSAEVVLTHNRHIPMLMSVLHNVLLNSNESGEQLHVLPVTMLSASHLPCGVFLVSTRA